MFTGMLISLLLASFVPASGWMVSPAASSPARQQAVGQAQRTGSSGGGVHTTENEATRGAEEAEEALAAAAKEAAETEVGVAGETEATRRH